MEFDLVRLEDILSPYIILRKSDDVVHVSDALAVRTGCTKGDIQGFLASNTNLFDVLGRNGQTVSLPVKGGDAFPCTYTCTSVNGTEIFAFSDVCRGFDDPLDHVIPEILVTMALFSTGACLIVERGHIIHANNGFANLVGIPVTGAIGQQVIGFISRQSREEFISACETSFKDPDKIAHPIEIMLTANSGRRVFVTMIGGWFKDGDKDYLWMVMNDITETMGLKKRLKDEEQRFSDLYDLSPIGLLYVNPRGVILSCNEFVSRLVGFDREEINGANFTKFVVPHEVERLREEFRDLFREGSSLHRRECMLRTKDGRDITIEYNVKVISRKNRNVQALMVFSDVTDKKGLEMELLEKNAEMEKTLWEMAEVKDALEARAGELNRATEELKVLNEKLNQLSITDGLTEIFNHRHFQDRLTEEVERVHRTPGGLLSLLILDIDDFKHFNDTYGHQCGDIVLKQLAGILKSNVRAVDIIARYGGEEFAVILPNANSREAAMVAERICQSVRSTPFSFGNGTSVKVTVSIGVGSLVHGQGDKSELVRKADNALYAAKAKWKDWVEIWEEED
ncbi:MAG TPA: sensor domain-containing diguanylate cyclase [Deltaproteobacteria bacterium]|nr:sensor domain-containing diguanylate cyclase [Deltaproteobacteria bacterium]